MSWSIDATIDYEYNPDDVVYTVGTYQTETYARDSVISIFKPVFEMKNLQSALALCNYLNGGNGEQKKAFELMGGVNSLSDYPLVQISKINKEEK
jgi:hypothetical protein